MTQYVCVCGNDRFPVTFEFDGSKAPEQQHTAYVRLDDKGKTVARIGTTQAEALDRLGKALATVLHQEVRVVSSDQGPSAVPPAAAPTAESPKPKTVKRKVKKRKRAVARSVPSQDVPATVPSEPPSAFSAKNADKATCFNCPFWNRSGLAAVVVSGFGEEQYDGECREGTPIHIQGAANAKWPITRQDKWCGRHPGRRV